MLEVDCGAKPLALPNLSTGQLFSNFFILTNIYDIVPSVLPHDVVWYTTQVQTSHSAAAQGSREPCAHESQEVGRRSRTGTARFRHAVLMQFHRRLATKKTASFPKGSPNYARKCPSQLPHRYWSFCRKLCRYELGQAIEAAVGTVGEIMLAKAKWLPRILLYLLWYHRALVSVEKQIKRKSEIPKTRKFL